MILNKTLMESDTRALKENLDTWVLKTLYAADSEN